jgi:hypothetical protein
MADPLAAAFGLATKNGVYGCPDKILPRKKALFSGLRTLAPMTRHTEPNAGRELFRLFRPFRRVTNRLPMTAKINKIDQDAGGNLGEISELKPNETGSLTLTLAPGRWRRASAAAINQAC